MGIGAQVHVGKGGTFDCEGLSFGGVDMLPEGDGEPTEVIVAVWQEDTDSMRFRLSLGQNFEFSGQTWRLDEIDDRSHRWYATLTRVA
jgi:Family of unknown function (DUF6406)